MDKNTKIIKSGPLRAKNQYNHRKGAKNYAS